MTTTIDVDTEVTGGQKRWLAGLHDMYVFLSARPELIDTYSTITLNLFADDKREFAAKARSLGTAEKDSGPGYYSHIRRFGPHRVDLNIASNEMCERRQVGTKKVSKMVPPEGVELVEVFEDQPVYTWKCPEIALETLPTADDVLGILA
jgi:hypothetical protein